MDSRVWTLESRASNRFLSVNSRVPSIERVLECWLLSLKCWIGSQVLIPEFQALNEFLVLTQFSSVNSWVSSTLITIRPRLSTLSTLHPTLEHPKHFAWATRVPSNLSTKCSTAKCLSFLSLNSWLLSARVPRVQMPNCQVASTPSPNALLLSARVPWVQILDYRAPEHLPTCMPKHLMCVRLSTSNTLSIVFQTH